MIVEQYVERHGVRLMISVRNIDANDHGKLVGCEPEVRRLIGLIGGDVAKAVALSMGETQFSVNNS